VIDTVVEYPEVRAKIKQDKALFSGGYNWASTAAATTICDIFKGTPPQSGANSATVIVGGSDIYLGDTTLVLNNNSADLTQDGTNWNAIITLPSNYDPNQTFLVAADEMLGEGQPCEPSDIDDPTHTSPTGLHV
jgi:hypothetical protein